MTHTHTNTRSNPRLFLHVCKEPGCTNTFIAVREKWCDECSYKRLKAKVKTRMHTVRRELYGPLLRDRLVKVTAKCPRCPDGHDLHTVELDYQPHIMPRLFCSRHAILRTLIYQDAYRVELRA